MSPLIQIRDVPTGTHRKAKARAALLGLSLSEFVLQALEREMDRPTASELAARVRLLEPVSDAPPAADLVRAERLREVPARR